MNQAKRVILRLDASAFADDDPFGSARLYFSKCEFLLLF
jgi:hypothetical protein